jgi:DNA-binding CsgD family transcriptional regulator
MSTAQPVLARFPLQRANLSVVVNSPKAKTTTANRADIGLILVDASLKPVYCNSEALRIVAYPKEPVPLKESRDEIAERIRSAILRESPTGAGLAVISFMSGRRRYLCRSFALEATPNGSSKPAMAITLEREGWNLRNLRTRYRLTDREIEAVQHLSDGLTSKEIAQRMNISPNTVKAFLRFAMVKMDVTTRSGVVGKLIYGVRTGVACSGGALRPHDNEPRPDQL